ncbi:U7 snRNA-associated Sm-like protein LSm11 [Tetranychus urticae]|uniref:U7 snRNA-associated Sm-like protein LSm11 n=1 Tax=Tetranychus urticae TaxID=32264 RepID=UPI00077B9752|nr:U7 snRNA-associated Sm-like protein LSm11 [Tetranychus urticae]
MANELTNSKDMPELDFESDKFDPLTVLTADVKLLTIPDPKAKTYNHLEEYERKSGAKQLGLLGEIEQGTSSKAATVSSTEVKLFDDGLKFNRKAREEELKKTLTPVVRSKKNQKSVLSIMNSDVAGPVAFLFKCVNQRVKVVIRRRRIVFQNHDQYAHLFGNLVAFDKHYNLVLSDVVERISLKSDDKNIEKNLPQNKRRTFKTIFIRGSNVIFVSLEAKDQFSETISFEDNQPSTSKQESIKPE